MLAYQNTPTVLAVTTQAGLLELFRKVGLLLRFDVSIFLTVRGTHLAAPSPLKNKLSVYLQLQVPRFKYANFQRGDSTLSPTTPPFSVHQFCTQLTAGRDVERLHQCLSVMPVQLTARNAAP